MCKTICINGQKVEQRPRVEKFQNAYSPSSLVACLGLCTGHEDSARDGNTPASQRTFLWTTPFAGLTLIDPPRIGVPEAGQV